VVEKQDDYWWRGKLNGRVGKFPKNLVTLVAGSTAFSLFLVFSLLPSPVSLFLFMPKFA